MRAAAGGDHGKGRHDRSRQGLHDQLALLRFGGLRPLLLLGLGADVGQVLGLQGVVRLAQALDGYHVLGIAHRLLLRRRP